MFGPAPGFFAEQAGFNPTFRSYDLAGSNALICADEAAIQITGAFSIGMWVKFDSLPASNIMLCTKKISGQTESFLFWMHNFGTAGEYHPTLQLAESGSKWQAVRRDTAWSPSTGTWYHLGCRWDASGSAILSAVEIYIDQSSQSLESHGGSGTDDISSLLDANRDLRWGGYNAGNYLDGHLADCRLWSQDLNPTTDWKTHIDPSTANLECYLVNDGATAVDSGDNALGLTTTGITISTDVPTY